MLYKRKAALWTAFLFRAENETRTRDPNLGKVVLYQLSYFRIFLNFAVRISSQLRVQRYSKNSYLQNFLHFFCIFFAIEFSDIAIKVQKYIFKVLLFSCLCYFTAERPSQTIKTPKTRLKPV